MFRMDPGPCPICGAAHCSCGGGPILVEQLPASAALRATASSTEPPAEFVLEQEKPPEPTPFTTSSYRGTKTRRK